MLAQEILKEKNESKTIPKSHSHRERIEAIAKGLVECPICKEFVVTLTLEEHICNIHDIQSCAKLASWTYKMNDEIAELDVKWNAALPNNIDIAETIKNKIDAFEWVLTRI